MLKETLNTDRPVLPSPTSPSFLEFARETYTLTSLQELLTEEEVQIREIFAPTDF